jgi:hypothetical protein
MTQRYRSSSLPLVFHDELTDQANQQTVTFEEIRKSKLQLRTTAIVSFPLCTRFTWRQKSSQNGQTSCCDQPLLNKSIESLIEATPGSAEFVRFYHVCR